MINLSSRTLFFACFLLFLCPTIAIANSSAIINEIAWMGTQNSPSDEWIELYNPTENKISLNGWTIKGESLDIELSGSIDAYSFYLLERTNDDSVPEKKADIIYKGSLSNKGDHLKLLDAKEQIVDEINCLDEWSFGDNETKQTMERKNDLSWQTSKVSDGTPKEENSKIIIKKQIKGEQNLSQNQIQKNTKSYIEIILISLLASASLTIIIFIIKKLPKNHVRT